ncbi:MAG: hypothetical protein GY874_04525 [Desulfobacteraceae bacterium]|nr:hypothetical protein [Desulfobacteraceae bacterium]
MAAAAAAAEAEAVGQRWGSGGNGGDDGGGGDKSRDLSMNEKCLEGGDAMMIDITLHAPARRLSLSLTSLMAAPYQYKTFEIEDCPLFLPSYNDRMSDMEHQ